MNMIRTAMLLAFMTALFMGVGYLLGGTGGMGIAFLVAAGMNLFSYWNSDKMVLRMHHADEVDERNAPEYFGIVRALAERANLPMPKVYLIENPQPNAFATGRNPQNAAVAATTACSSACRARRWRASWRTNWRMCRTATTLTMTITATLAGAISMLGNFAFFMGGNRNNNNPLGIIGVLMAMIVAPFAAMMVQMAISRDAGICRRPTRRRDLRQSDVARLGAEQDRAFGQAIVNEDAERNPATAHMFIVNPLSGARMDNLFSTHPDTDNRIAALQAMDAEFGATDGGGRLETPTSRAPAGRAAPERPGSQSGPWAGRRDRPARHPMVRGAALRATRDPRRVRGPERRAGADGRRMSRPPKQRGMRGPRRGAIDASRTSGRGWPRARRRPGFSAPSSTHGPRSTP